MFSLSQQSAFSRRRWRRPAWAVASVVASVVASMAAGFMGEDGGMAVGDTAVGVGAASD